MSGLTDAYEDALERLQAAFEAEFTSYAGTMSYLDSKRQEELDDLILQGVSEFPMPPELQQPSADFFNNAANFMEEQFRAYAFAVQGVNLKQFADALEASAPGSNPTFGQLASRFLAGDTTTLIGPPAEASLAAKAIAGLGLGATAVAAALEVMQSETPLNETGKQSFSVAGAILGGELGLKMTAATGNPWIMGGAVVIGGVVGSGVFEDFYDNYLSDILDTAIQQSTPMIEVADAAYAAAKNYIDNLWDIDGQAALDLWDDLLDNVDDFADDLGQLSKDYGWPQTAALPEWIPGVTVPFGQSETTVSPIVLDVDASGTIELVALNATGSVYWDIDQDGFSEASGWITGGDGLLAIDLDSDGIINDHGELFGGTNGYVTLDAYDTDNNNAITSADAQFGDLRVWIDSNADGYSQSGELHTLASLGITSIATSYSNVNYTIAGNQVSFQSTFVMNGNTYTSVDAFFAYDNVNSRYAEDYTLDPDALFLPMLRGYGTLPDLHIAMSLDEDLLEMVQDLVTSSPSDVLGLLTTPESGAIRDIMFRWAGVDGVNPTSRGTYIDARILEFLEEFMGEDYTQTGDPNPGPGGMALLMEAWGNAYIEIATRLVGQTMASAFEGGPTYNPITDGFEGTLSLETAEAWMEAVEAPRDVFNTAWLIVKLIDETVGVASLSSGDLEDLQEIMPWGITVEAFQNAVVFGGSISGSSADELFVGIETADQVYGNGGNDVLIGGGGNDDLRGGAGDDTYIFAAGSGFDQVRDETAGTGAADVIRFLGYQAADVRLWTTETGYLYLASKAAPSDQLWVYAGVTGASGTTGELALPAIEQVVFDDTSWSLAGALTIEGTASGDNLYGTQYGDTLYGLDGADQLRGNRGNDTLIGGVGNDDLRGGAGDDTYIFSAGSGFDQIRDETAATGTSDTIRLTGYASSEVRVWTESNGYLSVSNKADAGDRIYVYVGTTGVSGTTSELALPSIEQIIFDDTTVWSLTGGLSLEGTTSGDYLYGTQYGDTLYGLDGVDQLYGNRGNDTLIGGGGNDTLTGGAGDDTYVFASGSGSDTINADSGGTDTIRLNGYATTDIRVWSEMWGYFYVGSKTTPTDKVAVYFGTTGASGTMQELAISGIEQIVFDDTTTWNLTGGLSLEGTSSGDNLYGSQYGDTLYGLDGSDVLYGNRGNDTLVGGAGGDTLNGGAGDDSYVFAAGSGSDNISADSSGTDTIHMIGYATTDVRVWTPGSGYLYVGSKSTSTDKVTIYVGTTGASGTVHELAVPVIEQIVFDDTTTWSLTGGLSLEGTASNDLLYGTQYNDQIAGLDSTDTLYGNRGNDTLIGGVGNDTLYGGDGEDILYGGAGTDTLNGGAGADDFIFEAASAFGAVDTISDFNTGQGDALNIADLLTGYDPLTDAITDFVQITTSGSNSIVKVDADGGANNFVQIATISGVTGLTDEEALETGGYLIAA